MQGIFKDILGQERAKATLAAAISSGRVHHAWIFHGPEGVGKRTTAEAFAAALLDPSARAEPGGAVVFDPESETQALIRAETHPDLHIVTKEQAQYAEDPQVRQRKLVSIPKEVVEERLIRPAGLAPSIRVESAASKVFILDEAELMQAPTQNALLKTLEEPPAGSVIILVTSSADRLLPTIRSRCNMVRFSPLEDAAMRDWMERRHSQTEDDERQRLIEFSRGSPGLLQLTQVGGLHRWEQRLEPMLEAAERGEFRMTRDPFPSQGKDRKALASLGQILTELVDQWAAAWVKEHEKENPSKDAANKAGARRALDLLAERERLRMRRCLDEGQDVEPRLRALEIIHDAERDLAANVQLQIVMERLAVRLARDGGGPAS